MAELRFETSDLVGIPEGVRIQLTGIVDVTTADTFRATLLTLLSVGFRRIQLDFSGVEFVNSTGFAAMVELAQHLRATGGTVVLSRMRREIEDLCASLGLDAFFGMAIDEEGARQLLLATPEQAPDPLSGDDAVEIYIGPDGSSAALMAVSSKDDLAPELVQLVGSESAIMPAVGNTPLRGASTGEFKLEALQPPPIAPPPTALAAVAASVVEEAIPVAPPVQGKHGFTPLSNSTNSKSGGTFDASDFQFAGTATGPIPGNTPPAASPPTTTKKGTRTDLPNLEALYAPPLPEMAHSFPVDSNDVVGLAMKAMKTGPGSLRGANKTTPDGDSVALEVENLPLDMPGVVASSPAPTPGAVAPRRSKGETSRTDLPVLGAPAAAPKSDKDKDETRGSKTSRFLNIDEKTRNKLAAALLATIPEKERLWRTIRIWWNTDPTTKLPALNLTITSLPNNRAVSAAFPVSKLNPYVTIKPIIPGVVFTPEQLSVDMTAGIGEVVFKVRTEKPLKLTDPGLKSRLEIWYGPSMVRAVDCPPLSPPSKPIDPPAPAEE